MANSDPYLIPRSLLWKVVIGGFIISILWMKHDINQVSNEERMKMNQEIQDLKKQSNRHATNFF